MNLTYRLSEEDYVYFNLYVASKNPQIRKKRFRSRWIVPFIYLLMALFGLYSGDYYFSGFLFLVAILWVVFYPKIERNRYVKYFRNHILQNLSRSLNQEVQLVIHEDTIDTQDHHAESRFDLSDLLEISETAYAFYLLIDRGRGIIIPKDQVDDVGVQAKLRDIAAKFQITYVEDLSWEWK